MSQQAIKCTVKNNQILWLLAIVCCTSVVNAQHRQSFDLAKLQAANQLTVYNRTAAVTTETAAVQLSEKEGEGIAWITNAEFDSGTIEVDVKGKDEFQKSFIGIAFHGVNDSTYDAIYFRPFNFRATDSVRRIHAVQYISHPLYTWQKLRNERNAVYEKAVNPVPDPNNWFHARIVVTGNKVLVYVNDAKTPSLEVNQLNDRTRGKIGLWVGNGAGGGFKNLTITTARATNKNEVM